MSNKIQRMKKKLEDLTATQEKYLRKARDASEAADQLKREIIAEENNAIAAKVRELGITPEDFDTVLADYMRERRKARRDNQNPDSAPAEPEPSETASQTEETGDSGHDIPQ